MGDKTAAETEVGKYTDKQADADGWKIERISEARATKVGMTGGGQGEFLVEEERWMAEKTVDDHRISASGHSKEQILEQIRSQQSELDRQRGPVLANAVVNDNAGDAEGDENVGMAGVLPETEVDREALLEGTGRRS